MYTTVQLRHTVRYRLGLGFLWACLLLFCDGVPNAQAWYSLPPAAQRTISYPPGYAGRSMAYPYRHGGDVLPRWYMRGGIDRFGRYRFEFRVRGNARQFYNMWL